MPDYESYLLPRDEDLPEWEQLTIPEVEDHEDFYMDAIASENELNFD